MLNTGGAVKNRFLTISKIVKNRQKIWFFDHFGALWRLGGVGKLGLFCFLLMWIFWVFWGFLGGGLEILAGGYGAVLGVFSRV